MYLLNTVISHFKFYYILKILSVIFHRINNAKGYFGLFVVNRIKHVPNFS